MSRAAANIVLSIFLVGWAGARSVSPKSPPSLDLEPTEGQAKVVSVHDGDTLTVRIGGRKETVRLVGINTPELETEDPWWRDLAYRARDHVRQRALRNSVLLRRDPLSDDRDKYGRLVRYVILPDGVNLNEELVRQGYSRAYTRFPFSLSAEFRAAERAARRAHVGRWARGTRRVP